MAHPFPYSFALPADSAVWHDLRPHPGRDGYVEEQSRSLPAHRVGNLHVGSPAPRVEKSGRRGPARGGVSMDARPPGRTRNCRGLKRETEGESSKNTTPNSRPLEITKRQTQITFQLPRTTERRNKQAGNRAALRFLGVGVLGIWLVFGVGSF